MKPIIALAEQTGSPVATTFKAKGQVSDHHPLGCGVLGRSGTPIASWFMNDQLADALTAALDNDGPALVEVLSDPLLV